jgi:hypothetical protein
MNVFIIVLKSILYVASILFLSGITALFFKDVIIHNIRNKEPIVEETIVEDTQQSLYIITPKKED